MESKRVIMGTRGGQTADASSPQKDHVLPLTVTSPHLGAYAVVCFTGLSRVSAWFADFSKRESLATRPKAGVIG
jgi:hypothetical protein